MGEPRADEGVRLELSDMREATCSRLYRMRHLIDMDPEYQRQGGVWTTRTRQLFIDSLINGFDVPKLYLHHSTSLAGFKYAVIDGKQRLEAIFGFFEDQYPLSERFEFVNRDQLDLLDISMEDAKHLPGLLFTEIQERFPDVAKTLEAKSLDVVLLKTDDLDAIEEMFSRLNEAVPLNAAEKRNAVGGPLPAIVKLLASHEFFRKTLPFGNRRYRHYDLAAKFMLWALPAKGAVAGRAQRVRDSKRSILDALFEQARNGDPSEALLSEATEIATGVLDWMRDEYEDEDRLLYSVGTVAVVYLAALEAFRSHEPPFLTRSVLQTFERVRRDPSFVESEAEGLVRGVRALLEYNRLSQSPNDGSALATRLAILRAFAELDPESQSDPSAVLTAVGDAMPDDY